MSSPRPASSTSPWTIFDWPSGVPVIIRSFGSSVIYCDVYDISSGTLYHRSRVLPFCFNSPFTRSHRSTLWQSGISCFDMNLDTGLAVSKPFPRLQGKPFCRAGPYKWKSISRWSISIQKRSSNQPVHSEQSSPIPDNNHRRIPSPHPRRHFYISFQWQRPIRLHAVHSRAHLATANAKRRFLLFNLKYTQQSIVIDWPLWARLLLYNSLMVWEIALEPLVFHLSGHCKFIK